MNNVIAMDRITQTAFDALQCSSLGEELTEKQCRKLADALRVSGLKDGQFLIDEGEIDNSVHVVMEGHLDVITKNVNGELINLHRLEQGDMAGEIGFMDGLPHAAGLRAHDNTIIYSLTREDLESLLQSDPEIVYKVMRAILKQVHGKLSRMNTQFVEMSGR